MTIAPSSIFQLRSPDHPLSVLPSKSDVQPLCSSKSIGSGCRNPGPRPAPRPCGAPGAVGGCWATIDVPTTPARTIAIAAAVEWRSAMRMMFTKLSKLLQIDVPELRLHRRPGVKLESDEAAERAVLRVVVDDDAHHGTVENLDDGVAARDEMRLV